IDRAFNASRPTSLSVGLARIQSRVGDLGRRYLSAPRGILVEHPFLDPRLLRFCLGIHARIEPWPRGVLKPVLNAAMNGILPDSIRSRPKAGFFNEPYFRGLARNVSTLRAVIGRAVAPASEWLDSNALLRSLEQSLLGIGNRRIQLDRLDLTLSLL